MVQVGLTINAAKINKDINKIVGPKGISAKIRKQLIPNVVGKSTLTAWKFAKLFAFRFQFEGTLRRAITHKVYKNRGVVEVKGGQKVIQEALLNEYGIGALPGFSVKKQYKSQVTPKLRRWMDMKIPRAKSIHVGRQPGTRFGKNKFLRPAVLETYKRLPSIIKKELSKLK
jgi:hypothetical protein